MGTDSAGARVQEIGGPVPDFSLEDPAGAPRSLAAELEGHDAAVVIFWSCVCSHCLRYDEYLNSFQQRYPNVALLALASRQQESADELRRAVRDRRLLFTILIDPRGQTARQWHTEQTPRAFLISADMRLRYRGAIDNFQLPGDPDHVAYLEPAIADVLAGRPVSQPETASFGCAIQSVYYQLQKIL